MPNLNRDPVDPVTRALLHGAARRNAIGVGKPFRGVIVNARLVESDGYVRIAGNFNPADPVITSYVVNMRQLTDDVGVLLVLVETRNSAYLAWLPERDYATYVANKRKYKTED